MILAKKAEGRPVMPEEYQVLSQFVDRVERGLVRQREKEKQAEEERQRVAQAVVPDAAYDIPLGRSGDFPEVFNDPGWSWVPHSGRSVTSIEPGSRRNPGIGWHRAKGDERYRRGPG